MILNLQILIYYILLVVTMIAGISTLPVALRLYSKAGKEADLEELYDRDRKIYLVSTVFSLMIWARLVMVPLWFWGLGSLVPSVPGAMCLTGILMLNPGYAFSATLMKFILPMVYGYFLLLHKLDGMDERQPFTKEKLGLALPAGILIFVEGWFDLQTLTSVKPRVVTCCTSVFDVPEVQAIKTINDSNFQYVWFFLIIALTMVGYTLMRLRRLKSYKSGANQHKAGMIDYGIALFLGLITFISFVITLHGKIAPVLLGLPYHHCVFCLWQKDWWSIGFTGLVLVGLWLMVAALMAGRGGRLNEVGFVAIRNQVERLIMIGLGCFGAGILIMMVRYVSM